MTPTARCPDFPLTDALRNHLLQRFTQALESFGHRIAGAEVSLRSLHRGTWNGEGVQVQVKVELDGMESLTVTATSRDAVTAIGIAARRARRAVKRAVRRHRRIEQLGLRTLASASGRPAYKIG